MYVESARNVEVAILVGLRYIFQIEDLEILGSRQVYVRHPPTPTNNAHAVPLNVDVDHRKSFGAV